MNEAKKRRPKEDELKSTNAHSDNTDMAMTVISKALQTPGIKVDRESFLRSQFKDLPLDVKNLIVEKGPIVANRSRVELKKKAHHIVIQNTLESTGASFAAGLPGGLAMALTIPADVAQFYAIALRTAQEIAYLYGDDDLFDGGALDNEKVLNQLVLYCGVMFGATGASATVRVVSSQLAKTALKKLPQRALTKGIIFPVVRAISKALSIQMTKGIFAKGVSKAIPVVGGVVSGGITLASMRPMGMRLVSTFDEAHFAYSEDHLQTDLSILQEVTEDKNQKQIRRKNL